MTEPHYTDRPERYELTEQDLAIATHRKRQPGIGDAADREVAQQ